VLAVCCLSALMVGMDATILNVALPSIKRDLHASIAGAQWSVDAYTLVLACLLMLSGSTADRIGRRRTFQAGLLTFTAGSLLCSVAPSLGWLVVFRMMQAVGGSMLTPVAVSIITNTFVDQRSLARAIGVLSGTIGLATAAGPLLGGALVQGIGWRSVFWVNVPVGLAAVVLVARFVPESRAPRPRRVDPLGQLLLIGLLGLLVFGIIEARSHGWGSAEIVICLAGAAACLAGLVICERARAEPLIDPDFFRSAPFSGACVIAVCMFGALGGFLFLNTLLLQDVRHFSPLHAGLAILPFAGAWMLVAPISGRAVGKHGPRPSLLIGAASITAAGVLSAVSQGSPPDTRLFAAYTLLGIGMGCVNPALTSTAVAGMPRQEAGVAGGINSTTRQVGLSLGVAVVGSVIAAHVQHVVAGPAFTDASRVSWWIIAGCGFLALVVGIATTGAWGERTAERTATRIAAGRESGSGAVPAVP